MNEDTQDFMFLEEVESITDKLKLEFGEKKIDKLNRICYLISKPGMSIDEACVLNRVNYEQFQALIDSHDLIRRLITLKELEYKKDLLMTLSNKARAGDDKLATWLLERRYPEEFARGRRAKDDSGDMMKDAIDFLQSHGDKDNIVKTESAIPLVLPTDGKKDPVQALKDILN